MAITVKEAARTDGIWGKQESDDERIGAAVEAQTGRKRLRLSGLQRQRR